MNIWPLIFGFWLDRQQPICRECENGPCSCPRDREDRGCLRRASQSSSRASVPTRAPRPNTSTRQSVNAERKSKVGTLKSKPRQSSSWLTYPPFFTNSNRQLQMYGYEFSWASFQVIEVMSSSTFKEKTIGYLAAALSFKPDTDVLMLATNLIKKVA